MRFLAEWGGVSASDLEESAYRLPGHHAVKHLFEVACGMDSMALGETQILGQVKNAYCAAGDCEVTGLILNNLFQRAIEIGKRARTETGISSGTFSIGAAAVELAKVVLGDLRGRRALLVGAGKIGKLAAMHLRANGLEKVYVASRGRASAEKLARELGGEPLDMDTFVEALREVDVVISSTSSPGPIITREVMEKVMAERAAKKATHFGREGHELGRDARLGDKTGQSPLGVFLIDIAVPRDIEPGVSEVAGVFLYNIDDLRFLVDRYRSEREAQGAHVRAIIDQRPSSLWSTCERWRPRP